MISPTSSHADHVIIRGHVFSYAEKAPFVVSGASVLGAIEYDSENDLLKCHECGEFKQNLSKHAFLAHDIPAKEYKLKHGLKLSNNGLCCLRMKSAFQRNGRDSQVRGNRISQVNLSSAMAGRKRHNAEASKRGRNPFTEINNQFARCDAQLLFRIQVLAAQVGHTPTNAELTSAGITPAVLAHRFGTKDKAIELCGLVPNPRDNGYAKRSLPQNFPTEKQLRETRMPWPKEYFGVTPDIALARRAS